MGASVVAYSTGISSAVADLNISQDKLEKIIKDQEQQNNDSTDTPHETPLSVSEVKTENAPEEKQSQQPSSEAEKRDQTISEKQQQKSNTNNNSNNQKNLFIDYLNSLINLICSSFLFKYSSFG